MNLPRHCKCWNDGGVCCYCDWEYKGRCLPISPDIDCSQTRETSMTGHKKNDDPPVISRRVDY
jgi:hypothetical protein